MATGTIVAGTSHKDSANAYVTISVAGIEFNCATPLLKADGLAKTNAELKVDLILDARRQLDLQTALTAAALSGVSGAVNI